MHEVSLTTLSYGGDCLGRLPDGRVVFIPYGIPGERVAIEIIEDNRNFARGKLVKLLEPSPERIESRCSHFTHCGGCHYQHMIYEAQLHHKATILTEQLTRVGKLIDPPSPKIIPCPDPFQYRNNLRFHVSNMGKLGILAPHSERVIPVTECHLPEESVAQVWPEITLEPESDIDQVEIRCGQDGVVLVCLEGVTEIPPEFETEAWLSAVYASPGSRVILAGEDALTMRVKKRSFQVSGNSFFQVNTSMAGLMVETLQKNLILSKKSILMDLYCGVGLFSSFFTAEVREVIGIEMSTDACRDFAVNLDEFDNVSLYEGAVERILSGLKQKPDVVILDPPRAGLHPKALDALLAITPDQIAYVACDPATLARDLNQLTMKEYELNKVFLMDMFPQTFHIETLVFLTRK